MIAQANTSMDQKGRISEEHIRARIRGDFPIVEPDKVQYMDVAPHQILSVAATLIPFLEHDDANRALMGSNMQRQSVPMYPGAITFTVIPLFAFSRATAFENPIIPAFAAL